jgi:hypothetical protein
MPKVSDYVYYTPAKTKTPQESTPEIVQNRDLFQTPNYAVDLLIPFIPKGRFNWAWEPASGDGKIARRLLEKTELDVFVSDIRYSEVMPNEVYNFLLGVSAEDSLPFNNWEGFDIETGVIITNPPFSLKRQFYKRCMIFNMPFALLIPADYSGWIIRACQEGAEKIVPTRRIDYITPSGKSGATGQSADFHSMWLTWGFELGKTETFVELSIEEKKGNI